MAVLHYDYIIIGAGAAGLMLADAMAKDDFFSGKSILLLDKDLKQTNDRTWCFWEKGEGQFDDIVHKTWNHVYFGGKKFSKRFSINPYTYKMVRGIDFYNCILKRLEQYQNITFEKAYVREVVDNGDEVTVETATEKYVGQKSL